MSQIYLGDPFRIFCFTLVLTIPYLRARRIGASSLPNDSCFFTPTSAKLLVQDVIMIPALIKLWLSSMVYQLCIFLNYNVFRILQRDLPTVHQDSLKYRQCRMHSIGYLWSFVFATKLLWFLQGYSKSRVSVFKLSDLINIWRCSYYNLGVMWEVFCKTPLLSS